MVVVCDINEVWRRRTFAALARRLPVLGVSPADWRVVRRTGFARAEEPLEVLPVPLPPGWASSTAWLGQRLLWNRIRRRTAVPRAVVVTSPHYLPLLDRLPPGTPTLYYASDDYRGYRGWRTVAAREVELVRRADHSCFVSHGLMERALTEYGVEPGRLSVCMNATEERFFPEQLDAPLPLPAGDCPRPVAGVVGGINDRLDFDLLRRVADLPGIGTLLLVGPIAADRPPELEALLRHPKCVAVGEQPHRQIHRWFQSLDVALIPYRVSEFNRLCSPMRLFDHLASGAPIVATGACDQVVRIGGHIRIATTPESFADAVSGSFGALREDRRGMNITWADRAHGMHQLLKGLSHG